MIQTGSGISDNRSLDKAAVEATQKALERTGSKPDALLVFASGGETNKWASALKKIKSLAGTWKGTHEMEGKPAEDVTVEYSVVSNGNAVIEKMSPGTPHEMISIYYDKDGKLAMTHYCPIGNRPEMKLVSSNDKEIKLDFTGPSDIDVAKDSHIHSLDLTFGDNQLTQNWTYYEKGAPAGDTAIILTRS